MPGNNKYEPSISSINIVEWDNRHLPSTNIRPGWGKGGWAFEDDA
jgi:hypothetical protein